MDTPRIKISHERGQFYPNEIKDFEWVFDHRQDLLKEYGECVILVYEQKIVGIGHTLQEAKEHAERKLAPEIDQITPIIEFLAYRHSLRHFKFVADKEKKHGES